MSDFRTSFDDYCQKWAKACEDGLFDDADKPVTPASQNRPEDFLPPDRRPTPNVEVDTEKYWAQVARLASGKNNHAPDVVKEDRIDEDADLVVNPNPVHQWTLGKDQDLLVTAPGLGGHDFEKLERMKKDLHEMISKVNAADARGNAGQARSIKTKIEGLQERIDDLSDTLSYERLKKPRVVRK